MAFPIAELARPERIGPATGATSLGFTVEMALHTLPGVRLQLVLGSSRQSW